MFNSTVLTPPDMSTSIYTPNSTTIKKKKPI